MLFFQHFVRLAHAHSECAIPLPLLVWSGLKAGRGKAETERPRARMKVLTPGYLFFLPTVTCEWPGQVRNTFLCSTAGATAWVLLCLVLPAYLLSLSSIRKLMKSRGQKGTFEVTAWGFKISREYFKIVGFYSIFPFIAWSTFGAL